MISRIKGDMNLTNFVEESSKTLRMSYAWPVINVYATWCYVGYLISGIQ